MSHFADRLTTAVQAKGNPLCVGLDPRWGNLPDSIRKRHGAGSPEAVAAAYEEFCLRVLDIVADHVPVVKPQSAFFELCGPAGMASLQAILSSARERGLITILDNKRGDIASTATAYAQAALTGAQWDQKTFKVWDADSLTINPYLGRDAIEPFLQCARKVDGGAFVLVRTSNPGSGLFQNLQVSSDGTDPQPLYVHVAKAVQQWTTENLGSSGYGDVGAVVGATHPEELTQIRQLLPEAIFLVPGFGAQGGTAKDVAGAFHKGGMGAIVNSSRGILFPYQPDDKQWEKKIETATCEAISALSSAY